MVLDRSTNKRPELISLADRYRKKKNIDNDGMVGIGLVVDDGNDDDDDDGNDDVDVVDND